MNRVRFFAVVVSLALVLPVMAAAAVETYQVDPGHSTVGFSVRHFFTKATGRFDKFEGKLSIDPQKPATLQFEGTIQSASINTNHEQRDQHLRSEDFISAEKHPQIKFVSKKARKDGDTLKVTGDLTIRGITKEVVLEVDVLGFGPDAWGGHRAGFEARGKIDRKDFGIEWNKALDTGGFVLGDTIDLSVQVEAVRK